MNILAVIPARGGSKGIKKKNIQDLGDKPLIAHTIESSKKSKLITNLIVSTDDKEIADIARAFDADVPFIRPSEISQDNSSSFAVIKHALKFQEEKLNINYSATLLLQPTTPFRDHELIDKSIDLLLKNQLATSVISIVNVGANHPHRMYSKKGEYLVPFVKNLEDYMAPRQHLPNLYIRSGDIYLTRRSTIFNESNLIGKNPISVEVPVETAVNIDNEFDLFYARHLLKKNESTNN